MKVLLLYLPDEVEKPARDRIAALLAGLPRSPSLEELRRLLQTPLAECFCGWLRLRWRERPPLDRGDAAFDIRWLAHQFVGRRITPPNVLDAQLLNVYSLLDFVLPRRIRGLYRGAEDPLSAHLVDVASALLDDTEFRLQNTAQARATRETLPKVGRAGPVLLSEQIRQVIEHARADSNPGAAIDRILNPLGWNRTQWASKASLNRTVIYRWIIRGQKIRPDNEDKLITELAKRCRERGKTDL
jgi:hypothetical protein